ncbi:MAG TPA: Fur family transcriptional regulator [Acidimicrobiales bacterium]|nr:Fur family transcriptional regulator [Acidimicrobiales bacterium]
MRTPAELTEIFRAQGLKVTPQREAIFRALHTSEIHPTAEAVYDDVRASMPTISLRTVYQTLNDLTAMGEIHAIELGTGSARFDPNDRPHHHLVCGACGRVDDLAADFPGVALPAENDFGFEVTATEIVFRGRCRDCAAAHTDEADHSASTPTH